MGISSRFEQFAQRESPRLTTPFNRQNTYTNIGRAVVLLLVNSFANFFLLFSSSSSSSFTYFFCLFLFPILIFACSKLVPLNGDEDSFRFLWWRKRFSSVKRSYLSCGSSSYFTKCFNNKIRFERNSKKIQEKKKWNPSFPMVGDLCRLYEVLRNAKFQKFHLILWHLSCFHASMENLPVSESEVALID